MALNVNQPSFAAGELSPSLHSRVDLAKYHVGAKTLRNMFVHVHGGASNRPGFRFIAEAPGPGRLIPFEFSVTQTYVLEFTDGVMRIYKDGGLVLFPVGDPQEGAIVEIVSPYGVGDLPLLKFTQSADTMFITHPSYVPQKLTRTDHHLWTFTSMAFAPSVNAPTGLGATYNKTPGASTRSISYKVSAVSANGEESIPSSSASVTVDEPWLSGGLVSLSWTAPVGGTAAASYNVYKNKNGYYGFVGTAETTSFTDDNISPVVDDGPKSLESVFGSSNNYPGAVGIYEQRMFFGRSNTEPQTVWGSNTGTLSTFTTSSPLKDDDAIIATLFSRQVNEIKHLVPMEALLLFTSGGEWTLRPGSNSDAMSPTSLKFAIQSRNGCSDVPPIVIGNSTIYVQRFGKIVRDAFYTIETDGYTGTNLTVLASHLLEYTSIKEWAYQQSPDSVVWCVLADGSMLSLTYMREHDIWAWAKHDTPGLFHSVCAIEGTNQTDVYAMVKRTIDGSDVYYVEVMAERLPEGELTDAFFVDCGISYDGAPATGFSGLDHLEGEEVVVLADGNVVEGLTVTGGAITLTTAASKVHVGLRYTCDLETLDVDFSDQSGSIQGRKKKIGKVTMKLLNSRGLEVGPDLTRLTPVKFREFEGFSEATQLFTGDKQVTIDQRWGSNSQVSIRQKYPLPLTVLAVIPEVVIGG